MQNREREGMGELRTVKVYDDVYNVVVTLAADGWFAMLASNQCRLLMKTSESCSIKSKIKSICIKSSWSPVCFSCTLQSNAFWDMLFAISEVANDLIKMLLIHY